MKRKRVDDGFDFGLDSSLNLVDLSSIQKAVKNFDQEELNISNIIFEELNWRKQTIQNKSQVKTTDISSIESNDLEKPFSLPITLELLRSKLDLESNSTTNNNNNNNTNTNQYSISSIVSSLLVDGFFQSQEVIILLFFIHSCLILFFFSLFSCLDFRKFIENLWRIVKGKIILCPFD